MDTISDRIKQGMELRNLKQVDIIEKSGINKGALSSYISGKYAPKQNNIYKIAKALNVNESWLMGYDVPIERKSKSESKDDIFSIPGILPIQTKKFPLLGNIACGEPMLADQRFEGYIEAGTEIKADFCVKAVGDSMINARILDGDTVFIKKQDDVENGEIAAVLIDCEATLKRVSKNVPGYLQLMPENPNYEPIIINLKELDESVQIKIIGKAVAFQSNVK